MADAMGRSSVIQTALDVIHAGLLDVNEGEVASYIPELAKVDPDLFGVAVATADGHVYTAGDADEPFTIQSVSKPFVYGIALGDHGPAHVLERIGVEPSGDAFNSIVMDERRNRPLNPMVNAGAIAASALVRGDGLEHRSQRVLDAFSRYAGRPLDVDWDVYWSERRTGHRNRAIVYLELNTGMVDEPVEDHLDLYFQQCSIKVTARDLAVMAATLANGGVNPLTGESALSSDNVSRVLTVMATCGMYDWSG
jgi:glutaminase